MINAIFNKPSISGSWGDCVEEPAAKPANLWKTLAGKLRSSAPVVETTIAAEAPLVTRIPYGLTHGQFKAAYDAAVQFVFDRMRKDDAPVHNLLFNPAIKPTVNIRVCGPPRHKRDEAKDPNNDSSVDKFWKNHHSIPGVTVDLYGRYQYLQAQQIFALFVHGYDAQPFQGCERFTDLNRYIQGAKSLIELVRQELDTIEATHAPAKFEILESAGACLLLVKCLTPVPASKLVSKGAPVEEVIKEAVSVVKTIEPASPLAPKQGEITIPAPNGTSLPENITVPTPKDIDSGLLSIGEGVLSGRHLGLVETLAVASDEKLRLIIEAFKLSSVNPTFSETLVSSSDEKLKLLVEILKITSK
jgi:hypothetical protein